MYKTIILLAVLYGRQTIVSRGRQATVFENSTLRRIFKPKSNENREWKRIHNEDLHSLNRSHNIIRMFKRLRAESHMARMKEGREECLQIFREA